MMEWKIGKVFVKLTAIGMHRVSKPTIPNMDDKLARQYHSLL
jgi:hypothetical protein